MFRKSRCQWWNTKMGRWRNIHACDLFVQLKKELRERQDLEFWWRQAYNVSDTSTDILTHVLPHEVYSTQQSIGPVDRQAKSVSLLVSQYRNSSRLRISLVPSLKPNDLLTPPLTPNEILTPPPTSSDCNCNYYSCNWLATLMYSLVECLWGNKPGG